MSVRFIVWDVDVMRFRLDFDLLWPPVVNTKVPNILLPALLY